MKFVKLKNICSLITKGTTPTTIGYNFEKAGINYIKVESVQSDGILLESKFQYISIECHEKLKRSQLIEGDILFSIAGALGRTAIVKKNILPANTNQALAIIRLCGEENSAEFIRYALSSEYVYRQFQRQKQGVAQVNLSLKNIADLQIPLPHLKTQKKIVEVLDKAQELIDLRKKQIKLLDELIQSVFYDMFGDPSSNQNKFPLIKMKDLIVSVTNGLSRRRKELQNIGQVVLRLRDIKSNYIDFSDLNRINLDEKEQLKYKSTYGDLLFIRVNGNPDYVGRCAVNLGHSEELYFNDHIMRVALSKDVEPLYMSYYLNGIYGKREIKRYLKTSAGQHTIAQSGLEKVRILCPPIELQQQFVRNVKVIEEQRQLMNQSLVEMENNFNSLMQCAFKGELFNVLK